jgi:hypothetical protein
MKAIPRNLVLCLLLVFLLSPVFSVPAAGQTKSDEQSVQSEIQRAKIFRETYPLISETDLYCAIFVQESKLSDMRIVEAEASDEKIQLSDADVVYINKGRKDGLEIGQVFLVVELGDRLGNHGFLASKRGRASVTFLEDSRAVARVEKTCGRIGTGDYLLPFEEKESLLGKDLGFEPLSDENPGTAGTVIYLEREYNEVGSGYWAIIDIGADDGVNVGQQLTVYRFIRKDLPRMGVGNAVVIDTGKKTATIKVLSCSDAIRSGYAVQAK